MLGLLMTAVLFSCSKDDEEISVEAGIVGTWTVASVDVEFDGKSFESYLDDLIAQMEEQGAEFTEAEKEEMKKGFEEFNMESEVESEMLNTTIQFREDNSVVTTDDDGSAPGTWSLNGNDLTVTIDNEPQTFEVRNMTKSQASLRAPFDLEMDSDEEGSMGSTLPLIELIVNLKK